MVDVTVPKRRKITCPESKTPAIANSQLFHLQVIDEDSENKIEDSENKLVKVHYIGYDNKFDEWQPKSEVIDLNEDRKITVNPQEVIGRVSI